MAKARHVGDMISSRGLKKVPVGTVVRYEPDSEYDGACSVKTEHSGWVSQYGCNTQLDGHGNKVFRILHVGSV